MGRTISFRRMTSATMPPLALLLIIVLASLIGCGSPEQPSPSMAGTTSSTSAGGGTSTTAPAPGETTTSGTSGPVVRPVTSDFKVTTVVQGLAVPWEMRFMPDGRLLITEREGRIVMADVRTGEVKEVGTLPVSAGGESGLMGLALAPDFPGDPSIYVSYTFRQNGETRNRLSRITLEGADTSAPRLGAEQVLVDGIPAGSIHDGSRVAFGPDGALWVTTGDSGDSGLAQQMDSLAGKVLRMTRDGQPAPGNPFSDRPYPFSLIYTLGHRNPQGLAFHPVTGAAYLTEHGPSDNDEINRLQAGGNYGWPDLRGVVGRPGFIDPVTTWSPTIAPAGALFYAGDLLPNLKGAFVFVTLKGSDVRVLYPTADGEFTAVADEVVLFDEEFGRLRAIAHGPDGALYIATSNRDGRGDPQSGDDRIIRVER